MNLFLDYKNKINNLLLEFSKKRNLSISDKLKNLSIDLPPRDKFGDISCNAPMILSSSMKDKPMIIGKLLQDLLLKNFDEFDKIELVEPGFLNISFKFVFWKNFLFDVLRLDNNYGKHTSSQKKYNIEFVSANPTGPLHVGHCRGAILGDVISNLLIFNGHSVTKEYYINDYGNQIKIFTLSVFHRIHEIINNKKFPINEDLYPGEYLIDIAKIIIKKKVIKSYENFDKIYKDLSSICVDTSMELIKENLKDLGIKHDNFVKESYFIKNNKVVETIKILETKNFVYKGKLKSPKGEKTEDWHSRNQLLFKSTIFGDDVDRPLQKEDNSWTYFANDIAYHNYKTERNFDFLINILGADHIGYIKRITSAVEALSDRKIKLICKPSQLVKLFKNGKPFKMSKRKGDYISCKDLVNEVGKDSVRFIMLNRSNDVELEFDFKKVTDKSKDNPVYYVQYAYARINSIYKALNLSLDENINLGKENFKINQYELNILKKISEWPKCVYISLSKLEPHRIPYYLYDLSTLFHSYWNLGKSHEEFRFIKNDKPLNLSKLIILKALSLVIKNGMSILGVSTPKKM